MDLIKYSNRFGKTIVDFWRLRPREFLASATREDSAYLSPYEFAGVFIVVGVANYSSTFALSLATIQDGTDASIEALVGALALRTVVLMLVLTVVDTLYIRAISRIWPIRGRGTFTEILAYDLYSLSTLMPLMAVDLLVAPLIAEQHAIILVAAGILFGVVIMICKEIPGYAAVNGVKIGRMWAGLVFWPFAMSAVAVAMVGLILGLVSLL